MSVSGEVPHPAGSAPAPRAIIDYDFQSVLAAPPRQRLVLWLMLGLIAAAAIGLSVARVDVVVATNGKIVTTDSDIVIQPLEASVVRSVNVHLGDKVTAGEVLATLDPTFSDADEAELTAKLHFLGAKYDRLAAELAGSNYDPASPTAEEQAQRDVFRQRRDEFAAKLDAAQHKADQLQADLTAHRVEAQGLQQQIQLVGEQEGMYRTLVAKNLASKLKLLDTRQRLVQARSELDTNLGEQQKLAQQIASALADRDAFVDEWRRKLSEDFAEARSQRDGVAAQLSKAKRRQQLSVMRAPTDATVLEVADRPAGSVLREAEPLMRLVPAGAPLVAEVQIDTRDVSRLRPGDVVTLKFEALPWQQFGLAYGVLRTLTPDVLADENSHETAEDMSSADMRNEVRQSTIHYRGRVEVTETKFHDLPSGFVMRPGLRLVADIKIGRRSVLQYILNPITRVINESLHEP